MKLYLTPQEAIAAATEKMNELMPQLPNETLQASYREVDDDEYEDMVAKGRTKPGDEGRLLPIVIILPNE